MSGFDCEFTEEPPKYLQSHCPICLLVLREPFQVTCCGKSFCRWCIQQINTGGAPCPTCNEARFDSFQNKGLQQPLYGFRVFCSNKESGCDWQGELGQLEQHLNLNQNKDEQFQGCAHTEVNCLYCNESHLRHEIEHHQTSQCAERPFTCSLCEEYESTYTHVVTNHSPVCKCRPVECPSSCGTNNLQHQHLEEHISTQCPLTYVECEFSEAGCDAKVYRKDLPSHLENNLVIHTSLLAREYARLKSKEREVLVSRENESLKQELEYGKEQIEAVRRQRDDQAFAACVPPIVLCSDLKAIEPGMVWRSKAFYSSIAGYKLQFEIQLVSKDATSFTRKYTYEFKCVVLDSEFVIPSSGSLQITSQFTFGGTNLGTEKHKIPQGRKESDPVSAHFTWTLIGESTQLVFQVIRTECLM